MTEAVDNDDQLNIKPKVRLTASHWFTVLFVGEVFTLWYANVACNYRAINSDVYGAVFSVAITSLVTAQVAVLTMWMCVGKTDWPIRVPLALALAIWACSFEAAEWIRLDYPWHRLFVPQIDRRSLSCFPRDPWDKYLGFYLTLALFIGIAAGIAATSGVHVKRAKLSHDFTTIASRKTWLLILVCQFSIVSALIVLEWLTHPNNLEGSLFGGIGYPFFVMLLMITALATLQNSSWPWIIVLAVAGLDMAAVTFCTTSAGPYWWATSVYGLMSAVLIVAMLLPFKLIGYRADVDTKRLEVFEPRM